MVGFQNMFSIKCTLVLYNIIQFSKVKIKDMFSQQMLPYSIYRLSSFVFEDLFEASYKVNL